MVAWGIPLAVIGLFPGALLAGGLLVVAGSGGTIMDVVGRNLLQRSAPDRVLTRVFGVLEGTFMGAFGLGAVTTPVLLALVGAQGAFVPNRPCSSALPDTSNASASRQARRSFVRESRVIGSTLLRAVRSM